MTDPESRLLDELQRQLDERRSIGRLAAQTFLGLHDRLLASLAESGIPAAEAKATAAAVVTGMLHAFGEANAVMAGAATASAVAAQGATRH